MERPTIPKAWLMEEYERRRERNRAYSLRAFANHLDLPSGRLSEILSDKRKLSASLAEQIADRLGLDPQERASFLECVERDRSLSRKPKLVDLGRMPQASFEQLSLDAFRVIADWQHFAILSLIELDDFDSDERWISSRLGIDRVQTRAALERLERLELIERSPDGAIKKTDAQLTTTHNVSSSALRKSHRQSLEQAIESLETVAVEDRDLTSMTMAIDVEKIPLAKELIKDFRRKLCTLLESGKKNEVYNLNIQLVPVTQLKKKKGKQK